VTDKSPDAKRPDARALVHLHVRDIVFLLSVQGERYRFIEVNQAFAQATGLSEENVVGKLVDEVIPEPSLTLVRSRYRTAIEERRTVRWEEVTTYPSGTKYGEVSVTPVVDADGRCYSLIGVVHDVTAEARARAIKATELKVLEMVAMGATLASTLESLVLAVEGLAPGTIASILLLTPDAKRLVHGAAPHLPDAYNRAIDGAAIGPGEGSCGTAAAERRSVVVADIETDPLWQKYRQLALPHGLRACWSTPILHSDGRVLGTFALYYKQRRSPMDEDLELIARAVHVAGIAIQRHELSSALRALSARVEEAREEERTGIAREIHDQLGQSLTVLKMDLAWIARRAKNKDGIGMDALVEKIGELSAMTDELVAQVRRISAELRPGVLDDLGLAAALSWQAQEFEKRTGILCEVDVDGTRSTPPRDLSTTVFRVLEEALTNVARHAQAERVDVALEERDGWLLLRVKDDGVGIQPEDVRHPRALGLLGIRERARRLGGTASFDRVEPHGTEVVLRLPLDGQPRAH
jgi:PAS domain S-box-containing protein